MTINPTARWRVRPAGGNNNNGGGFDASISGAGTDYSQQDAAQASGTLGTASGTTTFSDAGDLFTAAMVGNALWITSGAGFTVGAYFITAYTNSSTVTLDRSPGTGTVANWSVGGGWSSFANANNSIGSVVAGNIIYLLGSGIPNPSSYTYDLTITSEISIYGTSRSVIVIANDPMTPNYRAPPDTTGGMPVIKCNGNITPVFDGRYLKLSGLWIVTNTLTAGNVILTSPGGFDSSIFGCVVDQFGIDCEASSGSTSLINSEVFSSTGGSGGTHYAGGGSFVLNSNIHDTVGRGTTCNIFNSIIAKCGGTLAIAAGDGIIILNCTIDGTATGIFLNVGAATAFIFNNIISNCSTAGIFDNGGVASEQVHFNLNTFYNNTLNVGTTVGLQSLDTILATTPYVNSSTENYMPK